jgi:membrane-associated protease RseP (regulator of RpoE activity)
MGVQGILAAVFILVLSFLLFKHRNKLEAQGWFPFLYFLVIRTQLGIGWMDRIAKRFRGSLRLLGYIGVVVGFIGMAFIAVELIMNTITIFMQPEAAPGVGLVLPFQAKGVFYVPFIYWILSIFIIAVIHEMSHGIIARVHNIEVKSSGFAVLGIIVPVIPAAFVEPDERKLTKHNEREQLAVFAAGPFSNILTGMVFLCMILFVFAPATDAIYQSTGIEVTDLEEGGPAMLAGMRQGEVITSIDGVPVDTMKDFTARARRLKPDNIIHIKTKEGGYDFVSGNKEDKVHLGVFIKEHNELRPEYAGYEIPAAMFTWFAGLFYWLFLLSLGIGLFNLVPIGPIDGGRMMKLASNRMFKSHGPTFFYYISMLFSGLILINIFAGFLK